MSQALRTSSVVIALMASWRSASRAASSLTCASYMCPWESAVAKIVGVGGNPGDGVVGHQVGRLPEVMRSRDRVVQPDGDAGVCESLEPFVS
jgi:hypothetical protein